MFGVEKILRGPEDRVTGRRESYGCQDGKSVRDLGVPSISHPPRLLMESDTEVPGRNIVSLPYCYDFTPETSR